MQAARARMMAAVPDADVVVTNPTHFAVALRYDGTRTAPEVVAKGQDLIAAQIRRDRRGERRAGRQPTRRSRARCTSSVPRSAR